MHVVISMYMQKSRNNSQAASWGTP